MQQGFIGHDGRQCGYYTLSQLLSAIPYACYNHDDIARDQIPENANVFQVEFIIPHSMPTA